MGRSKLLGGSGKRSERIEKREVETLYLVTVDGRRCAYGAKNDAVYTLLGGKIGERE